MSAIVCAGRRGGKVARQEAILGCLYGLREYLLWVGVSDYGWHWDSKAETSRVMGAMLELGLVVRDSAVVYYPDGWYPSPSGREVNVRGAWAYVLTRAGDLLARSIQDAPTRTRADRGGGQVILLPRLQA